MKNEFFLNEEYMTTISVTRERFPSPEYTDEDRAFEKLKGNLNWSSTSSEEHPEFSKLREELGASGYIYIERGWWNGDCVLKPFTLNGKKFKKGDKFSSAGAMGITFKVERERNNRV